MHEKEFKRRLGRSILVGLLVMGYLGLFYGKFVTAKAMKPVIQRLEKANSELEKKIIELEKENQSLIDQMDTAYDDIENAEYFAVEEYKAKLKEGEGG